MLTFTLRYDRKRPANGPRKRDYSSLATASVSGLRRQVSLLGLTLEEPHCAVSGLRATHSTNSQSDLAITCQGGIYGRTTPSTFYYYNSLDKLFHYIYLLFLFKKGHGRGNCKRLGKKIESTSLSIFLYCEKHICCRSCWL